MQVRSLIIILALLCLNFGCANSPVKPTEELLIDNLLQDWTRSYEEEKTDDNRIFRPSNSMDFPPSRFRRTYTFSENGTCEWLHLHPADAHFVKSGRWEFQADRSEILIYDSENSLVEAVSFRIIKVTKNILTILPLLK